MSDDGDVDDGPLKAVMIGPAASGKTTLCRIFTGQTTPSEVLSNPEYHSTIGIDFWSVKGIDYCTRTGKLAIFDASGSERYRNIVRAYFRGAALAWVVFDSTSLKSFQESKSIAQEVLDYSHYGDTCCIMLVANEFNRRETNSGDNDLNQEDIDKFLRQYPRFKFARVNIQNDLSVNRMFFTLARDCWIANYANDPFFGSTVDQSKLKTLPQYANSKAELRNQIEAVVTRVHGEHHLQEEIVVRHRSRTCCCWRVNVQQS
jgi:small GTP-binding protein